MQAGSLIESQHAPKAATIGASYADIMATNPPPSAPTKPAETVETAVPDMSSPPTDEFDLAPEAETVLTEIVNISSAKPVVVLPTAVTSPPSFPQVPSEISTFELPSPISTPQSSTVEEKPHKVKSAPEKESVLFCPSKTFETKKRYGAFVFAKGDPKKLERLNQSGSKLESRWAC